MGLQAKYDPGEDRMSMIVQAGDGAVLSFWVTRRQWLGLLRGLSSLPPVVQAVEPQATPQVAAAPRRPRLREASPVLLTGIRLRQQGSRMNLVLVVKEKQAVTIDLSPASISGLVNLLRQQAERAGWDAEAAMPRLASAQLAASSARKARLH